METTNPAAEVEQSPEERLEALFSGKATPAAPEAKQDEPEPEDADSEEPEAEEPEAEAVEDQAEAAEETTDPDTIEIELDGKVYAVPKELAPNVLKSKDYTQKTQELAEKRKEVEAQKAYLDQMEQVRGAVFEKATELRGIERQLERFKDVDWQTLADTDTQQYLKLDRAYRELQTQHSTMNAEVQQLAQQTQELTAKQRQQLREKGNQELARDIKGWGPELGKKLMENARNAYGFEEPELADILDPRYVKVLHDAYQWRQLQAAKPALKAKVSEVKPVTVKTARSTQNSQAAAATDADRQRLKKTGDPKAAEALLARMFEQKRKR